MNHAKLTLSILIILLAMGFSGASAASADVTTAHGLAPAGPQDLPDWEQVNTSGFGDLNASEVSALEAFNSYLYAGTSNPTAGARIFQSPDGLAWTPVIQPGFGIAHDYRPPAILDLTVFNSRLYASTGRGDGPGLIWRTVDGVTWAPMVIDGFGNPDTVDITALAVFNNYIYAGATNLVSGARIMRSFSGDSNTWTQVAPTLPGMNATTITGMAIFGNALYAAAESQGLTQIWRSTTGTDWTAVVTNGFGDSSTSATGGMAEFGGYLYAGAGSTVAGAQLWRTTDGSTWEQIIGPGFGGADNQKVEMVFVFQNQIYASVKNTQTGLEVWRSADGVSWEQVNQDGFGDPNNTGSNWSNATAEFLSQLYVGAVNNPGGGELWRMQPPAPPPPLLPMFVPLILRQP